MDIYVVGSIYSRQGIMVEKCCRKIGGIIGYMAVVLPVITLWPLPAAGAPPLAMEVGGPPFGVESSDGGPALGVGSSGGPPFRVGSFKGARFLAVGSHPEPDTTNLITSPIILEPDTDSAQALEPTILTSPRPDTSFWRRPTGVLFKSVIFPGWGQYANGKYQKAAVIFVLESFFIIKSVEYFKKTRDRFDKFKETEDGRDFFPYDEAKKTRNKYYWYVAGTIFVSMWDAYADAHIKPFEEAKDKGDDFWGLEDNRPDLSPPLLSLVLTIRF